MAASASGSHQSSTLDHIFERAELAASAHLPGQLLRGLGAAHVHRSGRVPLLRELRRRGIKVGVLSNTMWPRSAHEQIFVRDEVLDLIDGAVYTSEIDWVKPHPEAFRAAMAAVGETDPAACVFVGDRPYDDIHGAKSAGMRAVLITTPTSPRSRRPSRTRSSPGWQNCCPTSTAGPDAWGGREKTPEKTGKLFRRKALANGTPATLTFERESTGQAERRELTGSGGDALGVPPPRRQ